MKNNRLLFIVIGLIAFGGLVFGLKTRVFKNPADRTSGNPNTQKKPQVSASIYPLYFFSGEIAGNRADVSNLTPAGSEPHDYEPATSDIARLEKSKMLILNGNVETWGGKIKDNLKGSGVLIIVAGDGLFSRNLIEAGKTSADPHIWLSPLLAKKEAEKITLGFIRIDPAGSSYYLANEKILDGKFDRLDAEYKTGLANCKQKDLITSHAAFGYLAQAYGLNQLAISGLSPDAEPSTQELARIVKFAREKNIKYIFAESLVSPKLSDTVAAEIGAKTLVLDPLEGLSGDKINAGKNYFSVMEDNLKKLEVALECTG